MIYVGIPDPRFPRTTIRYKIGDSSQLDKVQKKVDKEKQRLDKVLKAYLESVNDR